MAEMSEMKQVLDASLERVLDIEGVKAAVIGTDDGEIISSGDATLAQVSAGRMAMEEGASADHNTDPPDEIILVSKSERTTVMRVNPEILLTVRAELEANQHLVSLEILDAAGKIKELMKPKRRKK